MPHPIRAVKNSINGLSVAWAEDKSFRYAFYQWFLGGVIATVLTIYWNLSVYTWLLLFGSLFPIIWLETINTSIEAVTDKASPERHPLAKKAKDIGSAAVLLARIFALLCWAVVLTEHILSK